MYKLSVDDVAGYLRRRGVINAEPAVRAESMDGGVSNDVIAVTGAGVDVVVKQALARLRVEQEWLATPDRILAEAAALRLAGRLRPHDVPGVIDVDEEAMTLTITRAPRSMRNWKTDLLAGQIAPPTAVRLAGALAAWHSATADDPSLQERFDTTAFIQLRIDPFYRAVAVRHDDLADRIDGLAEQLLASPRCLVHGDFSPKNVLADDTATWVLDWEVAHYGDPAFDLAFLQAHLLLKALHRSADASGYRRLSAKFLRVYTDAVTDDLLPAPDYLAGHVACLLLARVDGKSPAEYLSEAERGRARRLAREALGRDVGSVTQLWDALDA